MKKALKITLIALASLLAIIIIATLIISPIATSYINKNGKELIGRNIHVDKLKVNIYSGHVAIHNLHLYEDDDTTTFVAFDTLDVKAKLLPLLRNEVYLKHITLAGLNVNVLQDGDRFNFTSLIDHFASDSSDAEPDTDTTDSPWKLSFYNIRLSHGRIYYADLQRDCDWKVKDLNIEIPGFCIGGTEATDAGVTIELADGGTLNVNAHYDVNSNDFNAELNLDNFALSNIRAYLTDMMKLGDIKGSLFAHLKADGNVSRILQTAISGDLAIKGVDIKSDHNQPVLALSRLAVDVSTINLDANLFDIKSIAIDGLKSRFDLYTDGSNFSRLMVPQPSAAPDTTAPAATDTAAAKPMQIKVGSFRFTDGAFAYADHTLPDPFEFPVTKINLEADNISLSGENAARIYAVLPHGGSAYINWRGTLDDIKASQSLKLDIKNLQMADLSPYTVAYLGTPFTDGTFSFISLNTIKHSQLNGQNHLDIYKATVGKKRKDVDAQINIPLKAALYVLKDKDEKIQIDLPISGDLDNPEFKYMKVVWKTLGNLLVKVATEPFRAVGNALGISKDDDMFIAVDPQQTDLTSEQYYQIDKYASAMQQVPGLIITLEQQIDAAADSATLQLAEQRNRQVLQHFTQEMNVPAKQIDMTILKVESLKKPGYQISGKLEEDSATKE